MQRMVAGAILIGTLALTGAKPKADHAYVFGGVTFYRGSGTATAEYRSQFIPCAALTCTITLAIGKRDYGRFLKWCTSDNRDILVAPGSFGGHTECAGPNPWTLQVDVAMHNAQDVLTTHAQGVTIDVKVTP